VTGEPSGLSVTLPKALAELKKAAGPGARVMLGFDRGGAYLQVFTHCRTHDVHWVTCRRAPLPVPIMLPVLTTITAGGRTRQITWAEETVQVNDYGQARQITLSEHGGVAAAKLTRSLNASCHQYRCGHSEPRCHGLDRTDWSTGQCTCDSRRLLSPTPEAARNRVHQNAAR